MGVCGYTNPLSFGIEVDLLTSLHLTYFSGIMKLVKFKPKCGVAISSPNKLYPPINAIVFALGGMSMQGMTRAKLIINLAELRQTCGTDPVAAGPHGHAFFGRPCRLPKCEQSRWKMWPNLVPGLQL